MTDQFVAEIRIFAGNFAPKNWAMCNGQVLPISQNTALFSLLGTSYGGDGKSTFALPNLQGQFPLHAGQGPGLTERVLGETGGSDIVTLITSEIPAHNHTVNANTASADQHTPANAFPAQTNFNTYSITSNTSMNTNTISSSGENLPHTNMPPYLVVNFIIALQGVFPPRS